MVTDTGVYLVCQKYHAVAALVCMAPHVLVSSARGIAAPGGLQRVPPAGREHLVEVERDADVGVGGYQRQGHVPRAVEPPVFQEGDVYLRTQPPKLVRRTVRTARVKHEHAVRAGAAGHEPLAEPSLIFRYCVDVDFHCYSSSRINTSGMLVAVASVA